MVLVDLTDAPPDGWSILRSLLGLTAAQREILMDLIEDEQPLEDAALAAFLTAR